MRRDYLLITGLALLFFFPFLGALHLFDGGEIRLAECAREMVVTGEWVRPQIDFQPFGEVPPLFLWAQGISMQIFGINEFAARFPNAVCGLLTLLLAYRLGFRLHDRMFGWIWVFAWLGSFLPHFYFRSGMIDPWFNLFVFCGLYGFIEFRWQFLTTRNRASFWQKYRWLLPGGALLGLAILTGGPAAYLVLLMVLGLYWARYRFRGRGYLKHLFMFSGTALLVVAAWLGLEIALHGTAYARQFIAQQLRIFSLSGTGQGFFSGYPALELLAGCFPAAVFALPNLWGDRQPQDELLESDTLASCQRSDLSTWMQLLFWAAFPLSFLGASTVHFAALCYFPLTYLGAVTLWRAIRWGVYPRATRYLLPGLGIPLGLAVAAVPYFGQHPELLQGFFAGNPFALAALNADVQWGWQQSLPGFVLLASSLAGWYFWSGHRPWLAAQVVFAGGAVFAKLSMLFIVCNIEAHLQRAAVEFCASKCGEKCSVTPVGFKTYTHLFYTCKMPDTSCEKAYFVSKIGGVEALQWPQGCREIYRKNGFVFYELAASPALKRE